jgi:hypothetical protein
MQYIVKNAFNKWVGKIEHFNLIMYVLRNEILYSKSTLLITSGFGISYLGYGSLV